MLPWSMYLDATVSWEGHLSGGISGLIIAIIYRNHGPQKPVKEWIDEDEEEEDFFNVDDEFYDDFLEIQ
ncbi:MAG TPA: hypothetical protein VLZ33_05760 [Dysgonamonadaceae bacterium]|nr:hypothetical protein [Dysgonamonadaceae bacterium]